MSGKNQKKTTTASARKKGSASSAAHAKNAAQAKRGGKAAVAPAPPEKKPLLGSRVKNDLMGLGIAIIAVVLMVIVLMPSDAIGARIVSDGLRSIFGQGALLMPFLLLGWSATFFIRRRLTNSPVRLAIGLGVIYLALIALFGVLTPGAVSDPSRIFESSLLVHQGGYVGGGLAWALLSLVGFVPTIIILVGLMLGGLVLIGLSITGLFDWIIRTIKGENKKSDYEELAKGDGNAKGIAAPLSGSAYQMGPSDAAQGMQSGRRRSSKKNASFQATGAMAAAQLQDTLYQPSGATGNDDETALLTPLGSTRRKIVDAEADELARAQTVLFGSEEGLEYDLSELESNDDLLDEHPGDDATVLLASSQKAAKKKGKGKKGVSSGSGQSRATSTSFAETTFVLPNKKLLRVSREKANTKAGVSELRATANDLQATLEEFRVDGEVVGWIAGPTVTLYKISLGEGVRLNRVTALQSDIQLALAAQAIRIVAPIPGTSLVGIEIPNQDRNQVLLGDVLDAALDAPLALAIGKDVEGESIVADLASMPHLLIGGTTGSGKSVAINSIIMSLLMRTTPEEVRMIMIDPKRVELTLYNGIPHLYVPVVTDPGQAASALAWCVAEMDRRLKLFEKHTVKNIRQFNTRVQENLEKLEAEKAQAVSEAKQDEVDETGIDEMAATGELDTDAVNAAVLEDSRSLDAEQEELDITVEQENLRASMPYLVIVIDELADLMMMNGKEVEGAISRLAQLARAAGLHLIVATQRPSTNVITGLIKANIVNRIAFTVASSIDSRVILDTPGAEDLVGLGDMLFSRPEYSKPVRIQGCLVSEPEIESVVEYWRAQGETDYHEEILLSAPGTNGSSGGFGGEDGLEDDPLIWEAAEIIVQSQLGSTSALQRRLKVGYARAGRIMDMLEMKGVVGPPNGSKPREVLLDDVLDIETLRAYG